MQKKNTFYSAYVLTDELKILDTASRRKFGRLCFACLLPPGLPAFHRRRHALRSARKRSREWRQGRRNGPNACKPRADRYIATATRRVARKNAVVTITAGRRPRQQRRKSTAGRRNGGKLRKPTSPRVTLSLRATVSDSSSRRCARSTARDRKSLKVRHHRAISQRSSS